MLTTEEEAKTKRCHASFAACTQVTDRGYVIAMQMPSGGAYAVHTAPSMCIGSACMAWRWHRGSYYKADPVQPNHFTEIEGKGEYSVTYGRCGLAGPL